jgi:TPR repeat protein
MTIAEQLEAIIRSYASDDLSLLDQTKAAAAKGGIEDKFEHGRMILDYLDVFLREQNIRLIPEDVVLTKKLLLDYFEDLARQGHAVSMRYTASFYANGYQDLSISKKKDGYIIHAKPDLTTAFGWATKAAESGDAVGAKIRDSIGQALNLQP